MGTSEDENLKLFYRPMTTQDLVVYRAKLREMQELAAGRGKRRTRAYCELRARLIAELLEERGVVALN